MTASSWIFTPAPSALICLAVRAGVLKVQGLLKSTNSAERLAVACDREILWDLQLSHFRRNDAQAPKLCVLETPSSLDSVVSLATKLQQASITQPSQDDGCYQLLATFTQSAARLVFLRSVRTYLEQSVNNYIYISLFLN